jgi:hypothetical protein
LRHINPSSPPLLLFPSIMKRLCVIDNIKI